jgi:hypothetical protein
MAFRANSPSIKRRGSQYHETMTLRSPIKFPHVIATTITGIWFWLSICTVNNSTNQFKPIEDNPSSH